MKQMELLLAEKDLLIKERDEERKNQELDCQKQLHAKDYNMKVEMKAVQLDLLKHLHDHLVGLVKILGLRARWHFT